MVNDLNYKEIKFPVSKIDYCRSERQNNIALICSVMKII